MGGNALQKYGVETRRYQKEEYFEIIEEISAILLDSDYIFSHVEAYRNKESFGDADFVILHDFDKDFKAYIQRTFQPTAIFQNTNTYSFDFKGFQIDFILHKFDIYYPAVDYYSFSPSGNAIGKLFHQFGLSYGHEGLKYIIREENVGAPSSDNSHVLKEVILSNDTDIIHQMVGLDFRRWEQGFDKEEDIFAWVCKSPFFHPQLFSFEEMNHRARTRDKKRPDYNRLMDWIETHKDSLPHYERNPNKKEYLPWIIEKFPELQKELDVATLEYNLNQEAKKKFNGTLVMEWIGITDGKELGETINRYKQGITDFRDFIICNTPEEIEHDFKMWYKWEEHLL